VSAWAHAVTANPRAPTFAALARFLIHAPRSTAHVRAPRPSPSSAITPRAEPSTLARAGEPFRPAARL